MTGHVRLSLSEYSLRLRFTRSGRLSTHIGNTIRGGFGKALREISCVREDVSCAECVLGSRCAYGYLFETPATGALPVLKRYPYAPHPFILRPPAEHAWAVEEGTALVLSLVLVGRAYAYFPFVLFALMRLGELGLGSGRVRFEVEEVRSQPDGSVVYVGGQRGPLVPPLPQRVTASPGEERLGTLRVCYLTPLRLRVEERILRRPEFAPLVSAALRRLELLCRVHDEGDFALDAAELVRRAASVGVARDETYWEDKKRYSRRQASVMPMGGLRGSATFQGEVGTFAPLLALAGSVHVGKGTSFGHGFLRVEEEAAHGESF